MCTRLRVRVHTDARCTGRGRDVEGDKRKGLVGAGSCDFHCPWVGARTISISCCRTHGRLSRTVKGAKIRPDLPVPARSAAAAATSFAGPKSAVGRRSADKIDQLFDPQTRLFRSWGRVGASGVEQGRPPAGRLTQHTPSHHPIINQFNK